MGLFIMPSLGADMETGKLAEWLVAPGDTVSRGDVVAVVETQKGAIEIEVFESGTVHELTAALGDELPVGAPLAVILKEGEELPKERETNVPKVVEQTPASKESPVVAAPVSPQTPRPAQMSGRLAASPAARVRAAELGLALSSLVGTGPDGAILLADVERARASVEPAKPKSAKKQQMEEMRKAIAAAMSRSKQTIPHFYITQTMDAQPATEYLAKINADRIPAERVLIGAVFVRAAVLAAQKFQTLNGHYTNDGFQPSIDVNPGVAIALRGGGLVAPAMNDAAKLNLDQTMTAMRDLVSRARSGRLRGSEMTQGTITISSLGDGGAESMGGVIFPPQVALVGIGSPQTRPWIVAGAVVPRQTVTITLSADHRVADGRVGAGFLDEMNARLQEPEAL